MRAVITLEYLMSPAFCSKEDMRDVVSDLILLKQQSLECPAFGPVLENNAGQKLLDKSMFPSVDFFKSNFSSIYRGCEAEFHPRDISDIVRTILQAAIDYEEVFDFLCDVGDLEVEPNFINQPFPVFYDRKDELYSIVRDISILRNIYQVDTTMMYRAYGFNGVTVKVNGTVENFISNSDTNTVVTFRIDDCVVSVSNLLKPYLINFDVSKIVGNCDFNLFLLKFIVYVAALKLAQQIGDACAVMKWDDFSFGGRFIQSLTSNQSMPGESFHSVVIDTISRIVVNCPKYEVKDFTLDSHPLSRANSTAHRTHITKHGMALRLMFWKDENGDIEFANIGPKPEELIYD